MAEVVEQIENNRLFVKLDLDGFTLFPNTKKVKPNHPDFVGSVRVGAWVRNSKPKVVSDGQEEVGK